jgi:hypothetical protein
MTHTKEISQEEEEKKDDNEENILNNQHTTDHRKFSILAVSVVAMIRVTNLVQHGAINIQSPDRHTNVTNPIPAIGTPKGKVVPVL